MLGEGDAKKSVSGGNALNILATVTDSIDIKTEARKDGAEAR
jgi:hypothetical protein